MPDSASSKEIHDPSSTFYQELKEFRKRYPMCYLEAWTPEDFDLDDSGSPKDEADWTARRWKRVASRLGHEFDASVGTNWVRVKEVTKRLADKR